MGFRWYVFGVAFDRAVASGDVSGGAMTVSHVHLRSAVFSVTAGSLMLLLTVPAVRGADAPVGGRALYLYSDATSETDQGFWTNEMPAPERKSDTSMITLDMVDRTEPASSPDSKTSIRVQVQLRYPYWCGLTVATVPDYWGDEFLPDAFDLRRAEKLVFRARGDKGGEKIRFRLAITGGKPYGDSARPPIGGARRVSEPLSADADAEWTTLSDKWETYEIPLAGKGYDLSRVITPFAFFVDQARNPSGMVTFFLDDVAYVLRSGD
jgi:hypothetical protein